MRARQSMTQTMQISQVRGQFNALINQVYREGSRVMVEKSGIPVAGLVSAEDLRRLDRLDSERAERFSVIDEMRTAFEGVPVEEIEREAARTVAEIREEIRAEQKATATLP